jgi:hypothetical protein
MINEFKKLLDAGEITWLPVDKKDLDSSTVRYLEQVVERSQIPYEIASERVMGAVLFRLNDPKLHYLYHDPRTFQHLWIGDDFQAGLDNGEVLDYLAEKADWPKSLTPLTIPMILDRFRPNGSTGFDL